MRFKKPNITLVKQGSKLDEYLSKRYSSSMFTYREIFAMLGPLLIDQFFIYMISMLTASMVSSSSQTAVSAISLVSPITMILMCLSSAVSSGGTVIIAQYKGMGDEKKLKTASEQTMFATAFIALVCAVVLIISADSLVNLLYAAAETEVKEKAVSYMIGMCISTIPFSIYQGAFAILRGIGNTKIALRLTVIINVVHLVCSMIFINVLQWDIMGTAVSYIVARVIGCVAALYIILNRHSPVRIHIRRLLRVNISIQKIIFKMGIPFAAEQIFFNVGGLIVQTYLVSLGTQSISANANANSIVNLCFTGGNAVATLAITVIGQCIGAGDKPLAKRYGKNLMSLGRVMLCLTMIILLPLMDLLIGMYNAPADVAAMMKQIILLSALIIPFAWPSSNIMPAVLRAAGDANYTTVVSLITMWAVRVGGGYLLTVTMGFGVIGIWIMLGFEWIIRAFVFIARYRSDKWLEKRAVK